jgi:glycosyltransferase involved in cell wall biosynthesis
MEETQAAITISAVIPAYNAEKYIARAIDSVLNQTCPVDEIIVVDDGSVDNTADVIKGYGDRVQYIHQDNGGECAARNTGVQAASSKWIAFLDADDEWLPKRIELQTKVLRQNPSLAWVSSNYIRCLCEEGIQKIHISQEKAKEAMKGKAYFDDFFGAFILDIYGCPQTMMVRKEVLFKAGLFHVGQKRAGDMDMWWRVAFHQPQFGYVDEALAIYHLEIPGAASVTFKQWQVYNDMIERNLKEAEALGRLDAFKPAAAHILKQWLRSMLFDEQKEGIRFMMQNYRDLLSPSYRIIMMLLTINPWLTARGCRLVSRIVRKLHLRKTLVRPPV